MHPKVTHHRPNLLVEIIGRCKHQQLEWLLELIRKHNPDVLPLPDIKFPTLNGKLIIDPEDSFNDAEFEEEEMEEEEYVPESSADDAAKATPAAASTPAATPVQKKTIKLKRFNSAGSASLGGTPTTTTTTPISSAAGQQQSLLSVSQKRPLDSSNGSNKSSTDCSSIRPKAPKISDSPNKVVTTQN
ncbi:sentrin/sumo-specific protease senp7 [Culex quinquefasciatus]|uniref:Sentrin/sumo-specific protease senp7 n=1 Tax=Culex quinquefasciatus TaxID=7176 RepID=B0W5A5_CULQU|nr:sentrin/sumo-specific protease senp7 [Culex quinquefasciatus]|eukprot:XP_001843893.1 sentrin/sumo-specific protease senp7 [Culex quinquefasciatus]